MSLNGTQNNLYPNSLDGLSTTNTDALYINGQLIDPLNLVVYTGATKTLNMGNQNIQTTHSATASNDVVNLATLSGINSNQSSYILGIVDTNYVKYSGANSDVNLGSHNIQTSYAPTLNNDLTNKNYVDTQNNLKVSKAGDTMTGTLTVPNITATALSTATPSYTLGINSSNQLIKYANPTGSFSGTVDSGYFPYASASNVFSDSLLYEGTNFIGLGTTSSGLITPPTGTTYNLTLNGNLIATGGSISSGQAVFGQDASTNKNKVLISGASGVVNQYFYGHTGSSSNNYDATIQVSNTTATPSSNNTGQMTITAGSIGLIGPVSASNTLTVSGSMIAFNANHYNWNVARFAGGGYYTTLKFWKIATLFGTTSSSFGAMYVRGMLGGWVVGTNDQMEVDLYIMTRGSTAVNGRINSTSYANAVTYMDIQYYVNGSGYTEVYLVTKNTPTYVSFDLDVGSSGLEGDLASVQLWDPATSTPLTSAPGTMVSLTALCQVTQTGSNFGINTTSPSAYLNINSKSYQTMQLLISGYEYYQSGNSGTGIAINVGVNRSGNKQLWITDPDLSINTTNSNVRLIPSSGGAYMDAVSTDGTVGTKMTISGVPLLLNPNNSQNVGIGTTNPTANLHVVGGSGNGISTTTTNTTSTGWSQFYLSSDSGGGGVIFKNGSARTTDGGAYTMTVRNDAGDLRLLSSGSVGMTITSGTGAISTSGTLSTGSTLTAPNITCNNTISVGGYIFYTGIPSASWLYNYPVCTGNGNVLTKGQNSCTSVVWNDSIAWSNSGVNTTYAFYKINPYMAVHITGKFSCYTYGANQIQPTLRIYSQSTGQYWYYTSYAFQNVGYSHTTYPLDIVFNDTGGSGWYDIYMQPGGNLISDSNDQLYIRAEVFCAQAY